jgi:hypothetical protein
MLIHPSAHLRATRVRASVSALALVAYAFVYAIWLPFHLATETHGGTAALTAHVHVAGSSPPRPIELPARDSDISASAGLVNDASALAVASGPVHEHVHPTPQARIGGSADEIVSTAPAHAVMLGRDRIPLRDVDRESLVVRHSLEVRGPPNAEPHPPLPPRGPPLTPTLPSPR